MIKKILVHYTLRDCPPDKREAAERAHAHHAARCPVAKSIGTAIDISTDLEFG